MNKSKLRLPLAENSEVAPRKRLYEKPGKRITLIKSRKVLQDPGNSFSIPYTNPDLTTSNILSSTNSIQLKQNFSFELFPKPLTKISSSNSFINTSESLEKLLQKEKTQSLYEDFHSRARKAYFHAEVDKEELEKIRISDMAKHYKTDELFREVKSGNVSNVKYLIELYPQLKNSVDNVRFK